MPIEAVGIRDNKKNEFKKAVKDFLKENEDIKEDIKIKIGHVMWDRLSFHEFADYSFGILPIAKNNSKYVEGLLICTLEEGSIVKLAKETRYDFEHLLNVENTESSTNKDVDLKAIVTNFLLFDKDIFDYYDCDLLDLAESMVEGIEKEEKVSSRSCWFEYGPSTITSYYTCIYFMNGTVMYCGYDYSHTEYQWLKYCYNPAIGGPGVDNPNIDNGGGEDNNTNGEDCNLEQICKGNIGSYPLIDCVYEKLKSQDLFTQLMQNFVGSSQVDLTWNVVSSLPNNEYGLTSTSQHNATDVNIELNYSKMSDIMTIALTLLHEAVHAEIRRKLISDNFYGPEVEVPTSQLWDDYVNYLNGGNAESQQHEYMIHSYTSTLGTALHKFARAFFDPLDVSPVKSDYDYFAYLGLQKTDTWKYNMSQVDKSEINAGISQIKYNYNATSCQD